MADPHVHLTPQEIVAGQVPSLDPEELREVLRTRNDVPLRHFAVTVALAIVPPLALYSDPSAWVAILGALVNVHMFNRCGQFVHSSDHACLFTDKRLDRVVGQLSGYFVGYLQQGHKEAHNDHHLYLNTWQDPDRLWCEPEGRTGSVLRGWLRDVFLISAVARFLQYIPGTRGRIRSADHVRNKLGTARLAALGISFVPVALIQLGLVAAYLAGAGFHIGPGITYYVLVYIVPLFVLYPVQARLRSNVEHTYVPGYRRATLEDVGTVRSVKPNWLEKLIVAPLNYEYHFEHHLYPTMPYYNAPTLRRILDAKGYVIPIASGYVSFLWRKWRAERELERRARAT
jgi:fatty acid desaturase